MTGTDATRKVDVFGGGATAAAPAPAPVAAAPTPAPAPAAEPDEEAVEEVLSRARSPAPAPASAAVPEGEAVSPKAAATRTTSAHDDGEPDVDALPDESLEPAPAAAATVTRATMAPARSAPTAEPAAAESSLGVMKVVAKATVRGGPKLSAGVIGTLGVGATVEVLEEAHHDGHIRVRIASEKETAWCSRQIATGKVLLQPDSSLPVPAPFVRVRRTRSAGGSSAVAKAALQGAILGASEAVLRGQESGGASGGATATSAVTAALAGAAAAVTDAPAVGGAGVADGMTAKMAAAKAAKEEAKASAAAKLTFQHRLFEAVREPSRSLLVGLGSIGAGAGLGPGYLVWRCNDLALNSKAACLIKPDENLLADAGDTLVAAPLLIVFLLGLGFLTTSPAAESGADAGGNTAAVATMASMGAGGDQRQMQRLIEGGSAVMGGIGGIRVLVDDACGALPLP